MHRKIKKIKKRAFTLLELMVCLAIIALLGSLVGMKGMDLLSHHRFHSALQTALFDLHRHQILAMYQNTDIVCTFKKGAEGFYSVRFESDSPDFSEVSHDLKEVGSFLFEGKLCSELQMTLFASGRMAPQGVLQIVSKRGKDSVFLDLSYPIGFQSKAPLKKSALSSLPPYPEKK